MKGLLVKTEIDYDLMINGRTFATTDWRGVHKGANSATQYHLSREGCDRLFEPTDADKIFLDLFGVPLNKSAINRYEGFVEGFEKAMELNKDKLFTEADIRKAYQKGEEDSYTQGGLTKQKEDDYIQSLQQPKEIEVEIETELAYCKKEESGCKVYEQTKNGKDIFSLNYHCEGQLPDRWIHIEPTELKPNCVGYSKPLLDENGYLILSNL